MTSREFSVEDIWSIIDSHCELEDSYRNWWSYIQCMRSERQFKSVMLFSKHEIITLNVALSAILAKFLVSCDCADDFNVRRANVALREYCLDPEIRVTLFDEP